MRVPSQTHKLKMLINFLLDSVKTPLKIWLLSFKYSVDPQIIWLHIISKNDNDWATVFKTTAREATSNSPKDGKRSS